MGLFSGAHIKTATRTNLSLTREDMKTLQQGGEVRFDFFGDESIRIEGPPPQQMTASEIINELNERGLRRLALHVQALTNADA